MCGLSSTRQEEQSRYRDYNKLLDADLVKRVAKGGSKQQFDEEKMRLDLERVGAERRQVWVETYIFSRLKRPPKI